MPCSDVTEVLQLTLDPADSLRGYSLIKRTCGRAVGEQSLIHPWASGMTPEEILAADLDDFLDANPTDDEAEQFLLLKHFFALRSGLEVLIGQSSGGADDACAVDTLIFGEEGTEFIGQLRVDILTEQVKSCGRCGKGCGAKRIKAGG
jgi:hypothetical protein